MLLVADARGFAAHDPGPGHPERVARLDAVAAGIRAAGLDDAVVRLPRRSATRAELERVHDQAALDRIERMSATQAIAHGVGAVDPDTVVSAGSWRAAIEAAGAGLAAVEALIHGDGDAAFLGVRPPGHHATGRRSMGFCLVNNVAVTAAALSARGESVCILDYDAHHGNGTQDIFWSDPRVLYVSLHEWPLYPGTGRVDDRGAGDGEGTTCNVPLPAGATGDIYSQAFDQVIEPVIERFDPDWLLVSAGFDAHRADPLTGLNLSAGDYASLAARAVAMVRSRRVIVFLEGGYDLDALRDSVAATLPALLGVAAHPPEAPTSGGPGATAVNAARQRWS